jgi:hypothetical protein
MSTFVPRQPCPVCGEDIAVSAVLCRFCGERLEKDENGRFRPVGKARDSSPEASEFLIPTNVSGWAIVSCYTGLIGFCLPGLGLLFAIPAVICGIVALRRHKNDGSYGSKTSKIRAIIGVVLGGIAVVAWGSLLAAAAFMAMTQRRW